MLKNNNFQELELIRLKMFKVEGLLLLNYRIGAKPSVESSKEFAEKLSMQPQQWQNVKAKKNHVQLQVVINCCKKFGVRPEYLLLEPIENEPFSTKKPKEQTSEQK
jgi:hypothetical protein